MRAMRLEARALAAASARASTRAAAPSAIDEEDAAVTVPSLPKAGFRVGIFSMRHRERRLVARDDALALAILDP